MNWLRRRGCRRYGHQWQHKSVDTGMCMASHSTCVRCGFTTWRFWEDSHA